MIHQISEWKWFGNAGHCIIGRWCRFHMLTQVGPWYISTIGEYIHPSDSGGGESKEHEWLKKNYPGADIGADRKYETMVFRAGAPCNDDECGSCGIPFPQDYTDLDFEGYNTAGEATKGHMEMCKKWAELEETTPRRGEGA